MKNSLAQPVTRFPELYSKLLYYDERNGFKSKSQIAVRPKGYTGWVDEWIVPEGRLARLLIFNGVLSTYK